MQRSHEGDFSGMEKTVVAFLFSGPSITSGKSGIQDCKEGIRQMKTGRPGQP
jgi:hypothetical protein